MKLWIVGEYLPRWSEAGWALIGVFDSEELAVAACAGVEGVFVAPVELNKIHAGEVNADGILMGTLYPEGDSWEGLRQPEVEKL